MKFTAAIVATCLLLPLTASAGKLTTVATLPAHIDGGQPTSALTALGSAVYGVTSVGGAENTGTIFQLDPATGQETILHSFAGGTDGAGPQAEMTAFGGKLYGTTQGGGAFGGGTAFSFDPTTGTETVLYSLPAEALVYGRLTPLGSLLYGTTFYGGAQGAGAIYSIDPATGAEAAVYSFDSGKGLTNPIEGVVAYNGALYGLAYGSTSLLYRLDLATGQATTLFTFGNGDGFAENGLIVSNGLFYGTTINGGAARAGTVFSFNPNSLQFSTIYTFTGKRPDGNTPFGNLLAAGGLLYGATVSGGASNNGTVFSVNPANGAEAILHAFHGPEGALPEAGVIEVGGVLLGTTEAGGAREEGVAFTLAPSSGQLTALHSFTSDQYSYTSALVSLQGAFYGTTSAGGAATFGSIFKVDPKTGAEQAVYSFTGGLDGSDPLFALVSAGGLLYGTAESGGEDNGGTLFSFDPSTGTLKVLVNFAAASVGEFSSSLTNVSGILYGTTQSGVSGYGALFAFDPSSNAITSLHAFTNTDGVYASGVVRVNGTLYGTASYGGTSNLGTVFSYTLASGVFSTLHAFAGGSDGAHPYVGLVYADGALFGSTGGFKKRDKATLYKLDPATGAETVLHTFVVNQIVSSEMTAVGDTLFGTIRPGPSPYGELFRFDPTSQHFMTIYKFQGGADGGNPQSSLLNVGNFLYGTTSSVTPVIDGTVFRIHQ